MNNISNWN